MSLIQFLPSLKPWVTNPQATAQYNGRDPFRTGPYTFHLHEQQVKAHELNLHKWQVHGTIPLPLSLGGANWKGRGKPLF